MNKIHVGPIWSIFEGVDKCTVISNIDMPKCGHQAIVATSVPEIDAHTPGPNWLQQITSNYIKEKIFMNMGMIRLLFSSFVLYRTVKV